MQLSRVVLPEPVPPEMMTLQRTRPMMARRRAALGRDRVEFHELIERQPVALEFADGEDRTVEGERRGNHINAAAVGQARVADGARFVDAAADLTHDALADIHQLRIVGEADISGLEPYP